jgi:hypothetical protein
MSDKELAIIRLLEKAERRTRRNRHFHEIAAILCISLLIPVSFKSLDLIFLFRAATVASFLSVWAAATFFFIIWRIRGRHPLAQVAANVDRRAHLNDQMKTAYWFIQNPRPSEWVDVHIGKTADQAGRIDINALYPRRFPRTSYVAAGLACLLVGLNFTPLSLNHNWLLLQAAPPFLLTDDEQRNLEATLRLLQEAKAEGNTEVVEKIEQIIEDLQQGDISIDEAIKQLEELRQELEEGNLDVANMTNGLAEMAAILRQAPSLERVAAPMGHGDLSAAAAELRTFSRELQNRSPAELRDLEEKFSQASENPRAALEGLARAFESTASALQRGDRAATLSALDRAARELEKLMEQIEDQEARNDAGEELGELTDSLEQRGDDGDGDSEGEEGYSETEGEGTPGEGGQRGEPGEGEFSGEPGEGGEPGESATEGMDGPQGIEAGAGQAQGEGLNGKGGTSFGGSKESAPVAGEATTLDVQLKKELLEMQGGAGKEPAKDEAAGERERSRLDYRSVPSNLTPAQKDLLNQDRIPWESRQLIKNYFQAVKPQEKK